MMQFVNKRMLPLTRVDLIHLLENKEVVIKDLTDKLQKELEAISKSSCFIAYYLLSFLFLKGLFVSCVA